MLGSAHGTKQTSLDIQWSAGEACAHHVYLHQTPQVYYDGHSLRACNPGFEDARWLTTRERIQISAVSGY